MRSLAPAVLTALLALLAAACDRTASATAQSSTQAASGPPAPKVTVALPVVASVADYNDHTGRTEAPASVEIRPRASGHITRVAFHEGDLVKKGELLFVIDPRPYEAALARAKAELGSVRADLELARKNTSRVDELFKMKAVAERDWDTQRAQLDQLAARRAGAEAAVQTAALDLDYAYVRSPIEGRIGRALVTAGNLVGPESVAPLATVVSVDPLYVYVDVDEVHGLRLRGDGASVARIGFPGEDGYPHEAPIDFIDNRVDPATGTLKVRVVVTNHDGRLAHGVFARVRLSDGAARDAVLVSDRAVATDQDRRFVWVIGGDGKAIYRPVKLGPLEGSLRVVRDGLGPTDRVVVRGLQRVRPGVVVAPEVVEMRAADAELATGEHSP
jgi:membrane fusion protein, multidrug efflux system